MLRDRIEDVLRGWHAYEAGRPSPGQAIDFDCSLDSETPPVTIESRFQAYQLLLSLRDAASSEPVLLARLEADLAYLAALMGQVFSLDDYVARTQGCGTAGWPASYVAERGEVARAALAELGIPWGRSTADNLDELEGLIEIEEAADLIRSSANEFAPAVRAIAGTDVQFPLAIENVNVEEYWDYWIDGSPKQVRLRLNGKRARFTRMQARQFALHEILGHGLQFTSIAETSRTQDVPWVRVFSVHAPTQVLFEGMAQALPLLVTPEDKGLAARVRLDHYRQLVRAELHLAINSGASITSCIQHAQMRMPFWREGTIVKDLADRSTSALLRSYLWAYPAGCDWFVNLIDRDHEVATQIVKAAYRSPFTPSELAAAWSEGPPIGGPGGGICLQ